MPISPRVALHVGNFESETWCNQAQYVCAAAIFECRELEGPHISLASQALGSTRERTQGCSLKNAKSVGLVYLERDHAHYREIKGLAKALKEEYGVKRVGLMSYVPADEKETPNWLVKKLDSGYLCKSDLNWHGWPTKEFEAFVDTPFDILIDLEIEPVLQLKFVVRKSLAAMKVGIDNAPWNDDLDVRLVLEDVPDEEDMEEVDVILQDPMERWREHTKRTLAFLNQIDMQ